jgi:hypothetical protein
MKRAHWLGCGGGLLGLVVVLLVADVPAASALFITALLVCPLMILLMLVTTRSSASYPQTAHRSTPQGCRPARCRLTERSL